MSQSSARTQTWPTRGDIDHNETRISLFGESRVNTREEISERTHRRSVAEAQRPGPASSSMAHNSLTTRRLPSMAFNALSNEALPQA